MEDVYLSCGWEGQFSGLLAVVWTFYRALDLQCTGCGGGRDALHFPDFHRSGSKDVSPFYASLFVISSFIPSSCWVCYVDGLCIIIPLR